MSGPYPQFEGGTTGWRSGTSLTSARPIIWGPHLAVRQSRSRLRRCLATAGSCRMRTVGDGAQRVTRTATCASVRTRHSVALRRSRSAAAATARASDVPALGVLPSVALTEAARTPIRNPCLHPGHVRNVSFGDGGGSGARVRAGRCRRASCGHRRLVGLPSARRAPDARGGNAPATMRAGGRVPAWSRRA